MTHKDSVVAFIKANPGHPMGRAFAAALRSCDVSAFAGKTDDEIIAMLGEPPKQSASQSERIEWIIRSEGREYGRARYSCGYSEDLVFQISREDILDRIIERGLTADDLDIATLNDVIDQLDPFNYRYDSNGRDSDQYEYEDEEMDDSECTGNTPFDDENHHLVALFRTLLQERT